MPDNTRSRTPEPLGSSRLASFFVPGLLDALSLMGLQVLLSGAVREAMPRDDGMLAQIAIQAAVLGPFVLLSSLAGHLSDRWAKDLVLRRSADAALLFALLACLGFHLGSWPAAAAGLVLLSATAAIRSPARYGYIRELVGNRNLAAATAMLVAFTVAGGLVAVVGFGALFELLRPRDGGPLGQILRQVRAPSCLLVAGAAASWILVRLVPRVGSGDPTVRFSWAGHLTGRGLRRGLSDAGSQTVLRQSMIGLSMFFGVAQLVVSDVGSYVREVSGSAAPSALTAILAMAALGLSAGAVQSARLSRNFIETGLVPVGAAGVSALLFVVPAATHPVALGALLFGFGYFGGLFLVPLQSLLQFHTRENSAGQVLAAANLWQNLSMLAFLVVPPALGALGVPHRAIFATLGAISLAGSVWAMLRLPQSLVRALIRGAVSRRFDLEVLGLDSLPSEGGVLLLGNHISLLDWAFIQMASPRPVRFLIDRSHYERWHLRLLLEWLGAIPLSGGGEADIPARLRRLVGLRRAEEAETGDGFEKARRILSDGGVVALFPEDHLSRNGLLSTFKPDFQRAIEGTGAAIVPFYVQGLWGSTYSHAAAGYREGLLSLSSRGITVAFGEPLPGSSSPKDVRRAVQDLSILAWNDHVSSMRPLVSTWIRTAKRVGSAPAIFSHDGQDLSGTRLLGAVLAFASRLEEIAPGQRDMGILLPTSSAGAIANLACLARGRVVVNLNYTQPAAMVAECARRAGVRTILSSRQFESKLASRGFDLGELAKVAEIVRMEDLKASIPTSRLVLQVLRAKFLPAWWLELASTARGTRLSDTAAILFSSGSEGIPKGVELSHANMLGNIRQTGTVLNPTREDVLLSCLPLFHAFGLTITTLMPLLEGIPISMQPDPTDARAIGRACARHRATILCGSSTFMRIYAQSKAVHPLMFGSLRLVVAGAEKLKPEVRLMFREKFGLEIYEGFGTTETTPVASTNLPDVLLDDFTVQVSNRPGTVGMPLPGSQFRIVDPETLERLPVGEAGLVLIGGTQIMKGYLDDPERTAKAVIEIEGKRWYKTGDKGRIDSDGFLWILDRYSRFAKIGGEMVSLGAVESALGGIFSPEECELLATAIPDPGKGERIAALYCAPPGGSAPAPEAFLDRVRTSSIAPLSKPSLAFLVDALPRLGSGKPDYSMAKELARELAGA